MSYFLGCTDKDSYTKRYKELALKHHPDRGGDLRTMQEVNAEFTKLKECNFQPGKPESFSGVRRGYSASTVTPEDVMRSFEEAMSGFRGFDFGFDFGFRSGGRQGGKTSYMRNVQLLHAAGFKEDASRSVYTIRLTIKADITKDAIRSVSNDTLKAALFEEIEAMRSKMDAELDRVHQAVTDF